MLSLSEENHLKTIYHLSNHGLEVVNTNAIAEALRTKPASVSDMLKKLAQKQLIEHIKYQGVQLTKIGKLEALLIIRRHRLWEVFLVEKLEFTWHEVHEIAEQMEHVNYPLLIDKLDRFLGFPKFDPHGDPIPDPKGKIEMPEQKQLFDFYPDQRGKVMGVKDGQSSFLQYLDKLGICIGTEIKIVEKMEFDGSVEIEINKTKIANLSKEAAKNIYLIRLP
ncbi:MAG: metal-dependent transcriptional regulator [Cytophagales bacterium]